jgi:F0F1-type ATP synthase assembly protein I
MTTVGAGLTTGARIGKGVLAGAIAAMGTGVTAAILWALVRLLVEAATKGDKADIKGAGIAALTNAIALIPALLVVGVVIGVIAGAAAKPRLPSFLMVLCALGWGAYSFFVVSKGDVGSLDRAIVPVVAAVVYVFWFGIAFESQFRARAEDVLGKERGRRGRRVT